MNRLSTEKRARILSLLVEGTSMRATSRIEGVDINTVGKLIDDVAPACAAYHDEHVKGLRSRYIECDEIWSFVYARAGNVARAKCPPKGAGSAWTFTAIDADTKVIVSYLVGPNRSEETTIEFACDLRKRVDGKPQITTDGYVTYPDAIHFAFGKSVDYAQVVKQYGASDDGSPKGRRNRAVVTKEEKTAIFGDPDMSRASTSYIERSNLTLRMGNRRFTRLTNGFSKKFDRHISMLHIGFLHYNFCRIHQTLRVTPAMEAGLDEVARDCEWIAGLQAY